MPNTNKDKRIEETIVNFLDKFPVRNPDIEPAIKDWLRTIFYSYTQQQVQEAVEENRKLRLHLGVILPMAKGYVYLNDVGRNREMVSNAEDYLAELEALTQPQDREGKDMVV